MITLERMLVAGRLFVATLAWLILLGHAPARANDTAAAMAAGGLQLVKSEQVRMVSEVLRIAPRLIEVNYVFENTGSTDITTLVAFPLPDLDQAAANNSPLNIPHPQNANFVEFQVWVDEREIKPDVEVRAFAEGGEITADLKRRGVDPVDPKRDDATWTTKVSFHWSQTFPAGKQVAVRHRYRPVYGSSYTRVQPNFPNTRIKRDDLKPGGQWCFDQSFNDAQLRLLDRLFELATKDKLDRDVDYESVQYVLKTGANWRGPIGRFELQIDKGGADLLSTCPIPGLHLRRAPYGFNAVATDYTPTSDLDILFVSGHYLGRPDGSEAQGK